MILPADDPNDPTYRGVRKKVAHDVYYVREVGMILDLKISVCTSYTSSVRRLIQFVIA